MQVIRQISRVPLMFLYFLQSYSFYWVWLEHLIYQILHTAGYVIGNEVSAFFYFTEKLRHLVIVERERSTNHSVKNYAARPDVNFCASVTQSRNDLGSGVVRRATGCLQRQAITHYVCQTKVNQSDIQIFVQ